MGVIHFGDGADFQAVKGEEKVGGAEFVAEMADEENGIPSGFKVGGGDVLLIFDEADHSDGGGGVDGARGAFVVKADISAGDGGLEGDATFCQSFDAFAELPEIFGFVRVAEVEVIGGGEGCSACAGEVSSGFCHGDACAFPWIERAIDGIAVTGCGENFVGFADEKNGGIGAWKNHGARADHVVVLAVDPVFGGDAGVSEKGEESGARVRLGEGGEIEGGWSDAWGGVAGIERGFVGELAGGNFGDDHAVIEDAHHAIVFDDTDFGVGEVPFFEDIDDGLFLAFFDNDEHALLRFTEHDFVGSHSDFPFWNLGEVNFDPRAPAAGGFTG